ncbi:MAG: hypothetical protein GY864_12345 [Desulfobacterales bacterium]|nr:hypothetical protein [Desulfobacterales bacterium]
MRWLYYRRSRNGSIWAVSNKEQHDQISAAEEHLRRAILECYQRSVDLKIISIAELLEDYKKRVTPYIKTIVDFEKAPDLLEITDELKEIKELQTIGRKSKSRNKWDEEWEEGIKKFIDAFLRAEQLETTLNNYLSKSPPPTSKANKLKLWQLIAGILFVINVLLIIILTL